MKSIFLTFFAISIAAITFSQTTIEETDLMMPGDTFLIHIDQSPEVIIDIASEGADLSWDFTGLNNDVSNFACYAPNNELEFQAEFPLSEFHTYGPGFIYAGPGGGAPLDNWGYMMFYTNSNGLFVEGFYSDYGMGYRSTFNTPAELLMFTSAIFSDSEENNSYWEVVVNENNTDIDTTYRRNVDKTLTADAWGTIMTDFGTYEVLRIHETGVSVDSVFGNSGPITVLSMEVARDTINNYYFWAKEVRHPVLTVHCDYNDNIEQIDYLMGTIYSDSQTFKTNINQQVFPNPAQNYVTLHNFSKKIEIFNSLGQIVKTIENPKQIETVDLSNFIKGIYIITDTNNLNKKLIIK